MRSRLPTITENDGILGMNSYVICPSKDKNCIKMKSSHCLNVKSDTCCKTACCFLAFFETSINQYASIYIYFPKAII